MVAWQRLSECRSKYCVTVEMRAKAGECDVVIIYLGGRPAGEIMVKQGTLAR